MAQSSTYYVSRSDFVVDINSVSRNSGRQIDWANVAGSYVDPATGKKRIPAGTIMGELLGGGKISPRVATTNPATCVLETTAIEGALEHAVSGYGCLVGGVLYENLLPDASGGPPRVLTGAIKTELNAAGTGFAFEQWSDNR